MSRSMLVTCGLVAVAAVVGGAIWFSSSRATEVNLTTARFVPGDAGLYYALNTDLTSSQWVATFDLLGRLGEEDAEDDLKDSVDEEGFDWEDDIAPFLGGNAAVYLRGVGDLALLDFAPEGAVILRCTDAEAALDVIDENVGLGRDEEYGGIQYFDAEGAYVAVIEDHLVIAFDEDSIESVIDVYNGDEPSLASNGAFQQLRDELTRNFLFFVYLDAETLFGDWLLEDPAIRAALEDSGTGDLLLRPTAYVAGATSDGFEFQAASLGDSGPAGPALAPRESSLIRYIPADAPVFFSTTNIAQTWEQVLEKARPAIDDAIREEGEYDSLDEALRDAGSEIGLESIEEVIQLLTGETVFAAWFPSGDTDEAEGVLIAEVDEGKARDVLEAILASDAAVSVETIEIDGTEVTLFSDDEGEEAAYAFLDGNLVIGTRLGVAAILANDEPALSSLERYTRTVEQMPTSLGTYLYLDLAKVLRLAEGGIPADLDEAEEALEGLIINVVDERGLVRYSGILTIED